MIISGESMRVIVFASCVALVASACGTVTGLSDDFQFGDDGGADGSASSSSGSSGGEGGVDGGADARKDSSTQSCSVQQTSQASNDIANASGDKLPTGCSLCLASMCCPEVLDCAGNETCRATMSCVFNCANRGSPQERQQCVSQCSNLSSFGDVNSCASSSCKSTCGQLSQ